MGLVKTSTLTGASFFKPSNHMQDLALLIEPTRVDRDVPNTYNNVSRPRDEVTADITVFANTDALEKGEPSEFLGSTKVVHGMLTDTLSKIIGEATIATVAKIPTQAGSGFVFRDASPENTALVTAFYEARVAEDEAAIADAPSFND